MKVSVDIAGVIEQEISKRSYLSIVLSELIDNSLDAQADHVRVLVTHERGVGSVTIEDNGTGCPDIEQMLTLGSSRKKGGNAVGRHGYGFKHASFWLCERTGSTSILTSGQDGRFWSVEFCWSDVCNSADGGAALLPDPAPVTDEDLSRVTRNKRGTIVQFSRIAKRITEKEVKNLLKFPVSDSDNNPPLLRVFYPALRLGKRIEIVYNGKPQALKPPPKPKLVGDPLVYESEIPRGRKFSLWAGIKDANDKSGMAGLDYSFLHRTIQRDCTDAAMDYSTSGLLVGEVVLSGKWRLEPTKQGLVASDAEELNESLHQILLPLLERIKTTSVVLDTKEVHNKALAFLNPDNHQWVNDGESTPSFGKVKTVPRDGSRQGGDLWSGGAGTEQRRTTNPGTDGGKYNEAGEGGTKKRRRKQGRGIVADSVKDGSDKRMAWLASGSGTRVIYNLGHPMVAEQVEVAKNHAWLALLIATTWANEGKLQSEKSSGKTLAWDSRVGEVMRLAALRRVESPS